MSSSVWIGKITNDLMPLIIQVPELEKIDSVRFFMEKANIQVFRAQEVLDLILAAPDKSNECIELMLNEE